MKSKQLGILLGLVVVLGATGWYLTKGAGDSWSGNGAGGKVIELPINDVSRISIESSGARLNLVKKNEAWTVQERGDYPANFEQVSGLLRKLWDLKTVQEVKVGASQFGRLELVEPGKGTPSGTKLEFLGADGKPLGALLLGKRHTKEAEGQMAAMGMGDFPVGRYVMPIGAGAKVSLVSDPLEEVDAKPANWLQRDFVKVENAKSIALEGATPEKKWKLTQDAGTGEWKLDGAKAEEKLDGSKASSMGASFANVSIADVVMPDAKPEDTGMDKPAVLTIETTDGFRYVFKIGKHNGENFPVKVEVSATIAKERTPGKDEKPEDKKKLDDEHAAKVKRLEEKLAAEKKFESRAFFIAKATIDGVMKDRAQLMEEKKPDDAAGGATPPPGFGLPGGLMPGAGGGLPSGHPPVSMTPPAKPPVTATTPPVTVPPEPAPAKPAEAPKPATEPAKPEPAATKPAEAPKPATEPAKPEPAPAKPAEAPKPATEPAKPEPAATKPAEAPKPATEPAKPEPATPKSAEPAAAPADKK